MLSRKSRRLPRRKPRIIRRLYRFSSLVEFMEKYPQSVLCRHYTTVCQEKEDSALFELPTRIFAKKRFFIETSRCESLQ